MDYWFLFPDCWLHTREGWRAGLKGSSKAEKGRAGSGNRSYTEIIVTGSKSSLIKKRESSLIQGIVFNKGICFFEWVLIKETEYSLNKGRVVFS